jgi:5-(aminomethyl)-3-furanmethanol phosphate kinase
MPPLVLKIGGSLLATGRAHDVLAMVVQSKRHVVIVPGGGAFADAVREAQAEQGFNDAVAHRLAILAMHHMAAEFQDMQPGLTAAETIGEMQSAWQLRQTPVWLPWEMAGHEATIPQDWSMTSDGLAAWLAGKLEAAEVALVKSCVVPPDASLADLAAADVTDPQFPAFVAQGHLAWHVLGEGDEKRLSALLGINVH